MREWKKVFPTINNKQIIDCNEEDLQSILDNSEYRENQYIEYKGSFSFQKVPKGPVQEAELVEFRNDVCQFANAEGGYLLFGIDEDEKTGIPKAIPGVEVQKPDKFELELRDKLFAVQPKRPPVQIKFIKLKNENYVVVFKIEHDYCAPYTQLENQSNYKFYKREGNQKTTIRYSELKNMFIQSRTLENEILEFRNERIAFRKEREKYNSGFVLFHMIPESFLTERKPMFLIEKRNHQNYGFVFTETWIDSHSIPSVDGLRYISTDPEREREGIIYNNGIVEYNLPLGQYKCTDSIPGDGAFDSEYVWSDISHVIQGYQKLIPNLFGEQRHFGCLSLIGCKNYRVHYSEVEHRKAYLDKDIIICNPIVFTEINNEDVFYLDMKRQHLELLLSVGLKGGKAVEELSNEIIQNDFSVDL